MNKNEFIISVNGLAPGETTFLGNADKEFFVKFENYEILDADLDVTLFVDKQHMWISTATWTAQSRFRVIDVSPPLKCRFPPRRLSD